MSLPAFPRRRLSSDNRCSSDSRCKKTFSLLALGMLLSGCGASAAQQSELGTSTVSLPPPPPPSPESITREQPGGDAKDAHYAALTRQKEAKWGWRPDKDRQARFPLPDRKNWTRVRFFFIDHLTGFRYGDDAHAVAAAFLIELKEGDPETSAACVQRFEEKAWTQVNEMGGKVRDFESSVESWAKQPLLIRKATGEVDVLFKHYEAALSWTGYPAYPRTCLIYAVAIPWNGQKTLAEETRDYWSLGFPRFMPLTREAPHRYTEEEYLERRARREQEREPAK